MSFAHWDKLLYGIERGECILFLGPELPVDSPGGEREVPSQSLARRLVGALDDDGLAGFDPQPADLPWIAQRLISQEDEVALEMQLGTWHQALLKRPSTIHGALAALPFRLIVTSGLDPLMETALREAGKAPAVERYHYRGRNKDLLPEPTVDAPVLFHLYGRVQEPASVVLSEMQLLDFLARLIARDPPLPNDLNAALTHGRLFLFLGFGLREWYLRILFHVLKVLRPDSRGFAIDALEERAAGAAGREDQAILFYRDNFKMGFSRIDPLEFTQELGRRYLESGAPARVAATTAAPDQLTGPAAPRGGRTVFICHASEDKATAREIHEALKRADLEPWLDQDALRGGDRWDDLIASTIEAVDYFVVVNSRALAAKSREAAYVNKEINRALEAQQARLIGHFIVPARIDDTPLVAPLSKYQAVDLRAPDGLRELVRAVKRQIGIA